MIIFSAVKYYSILHGRVIIIIAGEATTEKKFPSQSIYEDKNNKTLENEQEKSLYKSSQCELRIKNLR